MPSNRREFLASASAVALTMAAHDRLASEEAGGAPVVPVAPGAGRVRISELRLKSAAPPEAMQEFYGDRLGLELIDSGDRSLTFAAGTTRVTFERAEADAGQPFYHFAFNIPENKILEARRWQLERSALIAVFPHLRDADYPEDVVHFSHWNAHSIFFLDPAENVVEYIARHDLDNGAPGSFSSADILHASEIGFVVDEVPAAALAIRQAFALEQYRTAGDEFQAVGDEGGLLLIFKRGRNLSLGHSVAKRADVFPTGATIRGGHATQHRIPGFPYVIEAR